MKAKTATLCVNKEVWEVRRLAGITLLLTIIVTVILAILGSKAAHADVAPVDPRLYDIMQARIIEEATRAEIEKKAETLVLDIPQSKYTAPYASVDGHFLDKETQDWLYTCLKERGVSWYYDISLCQLYQESRYDRFAISEDALDCGIAQIRNRYMNEFEEKYGMECNPFNKRQAIEMYANIMANNLATADSLDQAISTYFTGNLNKYSEKYVGDVLQWLDTLRKE